MLSSYLFLELVLAQSAVFCLNVCKFSARLCVLVRDSSLLSVHRVSSIMSMSLLKEVVLPLSIEVACYIIIAWYQVNHIFI